MRTSNQFMETVMTEGLSTAYKTDCNAYLQGFFFQFVGNGAGSLAIGNKAQFCYSLGEVKKNMKLIN